MSVTFDHLHQSLYIVSTSMLISLTLLIFSLKLHFSQHFKCQSCCITTGKTKHRIRCFCAPPDGNFDFFPVGFIIYLIIWIFLCILLITRMIFMHMERLWRPSLSQYRAPTFTSIHTDSSIVIPYILIIDWVITYFMMLMALLESLFNFYRFYTTFQSTKYLRLISFYDIMKKYTLYIIIFVALYTIAIHLYIWFALFLTLLHLLFGMYCNWYFASLLIKSFTAMISVNGNSADSDTEMIRSVYFMRKASVICTSIQTIYLFLYMLFYCININLVIIYLPILWSISSFLFSLNFVRNRTFVHEMCAKLSSNKSTESISQKGVSPQQIPQQSPLEIDENDVLSRYKSQYDETKSLNTKLPPAKHVEPTMSSKVSQDTQDGDKTDKSVPDGIELKTFKSNTTSSPPMKSVKSPATPTWTPLTFAHNKTLSPTMSAIKGFFPTMNSKVMKDMSFTAKSVEESIFSETDIDGKKQEMFNQMIAQNASLSPILYPSRASNRFSRIKTLDIANDIGVLHEEEPIYAMNMEQLTIKRNMQKLDVQQLMLQLTLLKKFGFDVKKFELKLLKALSSPAYGE